MILQILMNTSCWMDIIINAARLLLHWRRVRSFLALSENRGSFVKNIRSTATCLYKQGTSGDFGCAPVAFVRFTCSTFIHRNFGQFDVMKTMQHVLGDAGSKYRLKHDRCNTSVHWWRNGARTRPYISPFPRFMGAEL